MRGHFGHAAAVDPTQMQYLVTGGHGPLFESGQSLTNRLSCLQTLVSGCRVEVAAADERLQILKRGFKLAVKCSDEVDDPVADQAEDPATEPAQVWPVAERSNVSDNLDPHLLNAIVRIGVRNAASTGQAKNQSVVFSEESFPRLTPLAPGSLLFLKGLKVRLRATEHFKIDIVTEPRCVQVIPIARAEHQNALRG